MRTEFHVYDPFHRDTSWITQEVIEDYVGSRIRGAKAADMCVAKHAQSDPVKIGQFLEVVAYHPDLQLIENELLDEFGLEYFIGKPKPKEYHIRQLEIAIEECRHGETKAKLYKELREMQGWTTKPAEKSTSFSVSVGKSDTAPQLDTSNPRETERIVMSIFSSVSG